MKLFKTLTEFKEDQIDGAYVGFGIIRAKDYDKDKFGRLLMWSINIGKTKFIKKLFIQNIWQKT